MTLFPSLDTITKTCFYAVIALVVSVGAVTLTQVAAQTPASLAVRNQLYQYPSGPGYSEMAYDPSTMTHCNCCMSGTSQCNECSLTLCDRNSEGLQQCTRCLLSNSCARYVDRGIPRSDLCRIPTCTPANCGRCVDGTTDQCAMCKEDHSFDAAIGACVAGPGGCRVANCDQCDPADGFRITCNRCQDGYTPDPADGTCRVSSITTTTAKPTATTTTTAKPTTATSTTAKPRRQPPPPPRR